MLCWTERKEEAPGGDKNTKNNNNTAPPAPLLVPTSMTTGIHTLFHDFPSNLSIIGSLSFLPLLREKLE